MEQLRYSFGKKRVLLAVITAVIIIAISFGVKAMLNRNDAGPAKAPESAASDTSTDLNSVEETQKIATSTKEPAGLIASEEVRLNCFLTSVVQQNIENTNSDLDEDAELIRFAFGYRKTNAPDSIVAQEYGGVLCPTLTLEQVNETLNDLFGLTVSPDKKDYSILNDDAEGFHCIFRDSYFWNIPPYPVEKFSFPLRFALVESIDEETCTLYFRLYKINPYAWGEGEAERHVSLVPMMSIFEAERGKKDTKEWILKLGSGKAVLRDLGEDLQLIELETSLNN